jgi:imidazolonepropionase-like amidohydrolase
MTKPISRREFFKRSSRLAAAAGLGGYNVFHTGCRTKKGAYLIIKGGTLIDGNGGPPVKDTVILIKNQTIKSVGKVGQIKTPLFAKTINAKAKYIIPGLIDMHVHFVDPLFCEQFLFYGVTTVRDVGNNTNDIVNLRDKINKGEISGPTIFTSGYLINNQRIPFGASRYTAVVKTPTQARRVVQILAQKKVDWIKIYITLPPKLTRIIIQEAKKYNLPVAGHLRRVNAEKAAKWGIKTLEHTTGISEALLGDEQFEDAPPLWTISNKTWLHVDREKYNALIDLLVKKDVYITGNLTLYHSMASTPEELQKDLPEKLIPQFYLDGWKNYLNGRFLELTQDRESWKITEKKVAEFLILFKERGGKVIAGTDSPWPYLFPGHSLHEELQLLVTAGFSPMEALLAATRYSAEALGQTHNLGTLETGKAANLIILNGNPLKDINQTLNINTVVKNGKIIPRKLY